MRELGFSRNWPKLKQDTFTTFRFPRKDTDWKIGEKVSVILYRRTNHWKALGVAKIVDKQPRKFTFLRTGGTMITNAEAKEDGFEDLREMRKWFNKTYGPERPRKEPLNKLTLVWAEKINADTKLQD